MFSSPGATQPSGSGPTTAESDTFTSRPGPLIVRRKRRYWATVPSEPSSSSLTTITASAVCTYGAESSACSGVVCETLAGSHFNERHLSCNNAGTCTGVAVDCGNYVCVTDTGCHASCESNLDCADLTECTVEGICS